MKIIYLGPGSVLAVLLSLAAARLPAAEEVGLLNVLFRRGDANFDGRIDLADAGFLLNGLYLGGAEPGCLDSGDVNDDGAVDDADPLYLLDWLFPESPGGSPPPPAPFPLAGVDLTVDLLGCLSTILSPPGPAPGFRLGLQGPPVLTRGQQGVVVHLTATTAGPIEGLSVALLVDRQAIAVTGADLEGTIFPEAMRAAFESSDFFRFTVIPQPESPRDLLLAGALFIGPEHEQISFPATTGPLDAQPVLRLLLDVAPDAPLGDRTVLESSPPPPDLAGAISGFVGSGLNLLPEDLPSYRIPVLADSGELILNRRADANNDRAIDISDPLYILAYLFLDDRPDGCADSSDANDDGGVDLTDPIYTLQYLFTGGPAPPAPYPDCGADPTPDTLPVCTGTCRS